MSEIPSLFAAGRKFRGPFTEKHRYTSPWTPPPREEEAAWREEAQPHMRTMVLEYESQHLPHKWASHVGKYAIHGAYGNYLNDD